ncbi:MAG: nucleoside deaminase [Candidatus ainarchaeum sp.]|nr:nucleoside deaminase [Candidatus ainarchaeum sp.]
MQTAILESVKSVLKSGGPFGAIIVKNGKIISVGHNEVTKKLDPTAHAEIIAIRKACKKLNTYDLSGCEIYTSSYPCSMCLSAIAWARLKKVYYFFDIDHAHNSMFDDKEIYNFLNKKKSKIKISIKKIDFAIEEDPFEIWNKKKDKKKY